MAYKLDLICLVTIIIGIITGFISWVITKEIWALTATMWAIVAFVNTATKMQLEKKLKRYE